MANADQSDGRRMTIACDMTIYNAEALKDELMHELGLGAALELDLAQVGVIDSSGIQLLMLASAKAPGRADRCGSSPTAQRCANCSTSTTSSNSLATPC